MIRRLLNNIEIKIACLFLAVIMWLYANDRTDILIRAREVISGVETGTVTLSDVPIELIGSKETGNLSAEPNRISISVICSKNAIIDLASIRAKVKLTSKDSKKAILDEKNVILPEGLNFLRSEPKEIKIYKKPNSGHGS
jgi:YbbR domain-containing protein